MRNIQEAIATPGADDAAPSLMRVTVDRDALHVALQRLRKFGCGGGRNTVPILAGVHMRADPATGLHLTGWADGRLVTADVAATVESPGEAVAMFDPFAAIVAKMTSPGRGNGDVELSAAPPRHYERSDSNYPVALVWGRLRASIVGFRPADYPAMQDSAVAFTMRANACLLATMAEMAARAGTGATSKGVRLTLAHDGLTVAGANGAALSLMRLPLPDLKAAGLAFKPKPGAEIVAGFEASAVKALVASVPKGGAAQFGFIVRDGAVSAVSVDLDGVRVRLPIYDSTFPVVARFERAEARAWFTAEAVALADTVKAVTGEGGCSVALADGEATLSGSSESVLQAVAGADAERCEPMKLTKELSAALKGERGPVTVLQCFGDVPPCVRLDLPGEAVTYLCQLAERPCDRFRRNYGAAYAARDAAAMRAAVADYRRDAGAGYSYREGFAPDLWQIAAECRGMKPARAVAGKQRAAERYQSHRVGSYREFAHEVERLRRVAASTRDLPGFDPDWTVPAVWATLANGGGAWIATELAAKANCTVMPSCKRNGSYERRPAHIYRDNIVRVDAKRPSKRRAADAEPESAPLSASPTIPASDPAPEPAFAPAEALAGPDDGDANEPGGDLGTDEPAGPDDDTAPVDSTAAAIIAAETPADLAALVAELVARVAALEGDRVQRKEGDAANSGAQIIPEIIPAHGELSDLRGQLAAMTAERDSLVEWAKATRQRTAGTMRTLRARLRATRFHHGVLESSNRANREMARSCEARADKAEAELRRLKAIAPLAGYRYIGGHTGAAVEQRRAA